MKEKTFYKTLLEFSLYPEKAKLCLTDKRLTLVEKNIVDGYLKIRNNQNYEVISSLEKSTSSDLPFVESQRLLLLGCALNNLSQYDAAENKLLASITILQTLQTPYFHFFAYFTLFWLKANLNEIQQMEKILNEMNKIPVTSENHRIRLLRCHFCFYQMVERNDEAKSVLIEIEAAGKTLSESDSIHFLSDKFIFYIQLEDFNASYEVLEEMRKYRKFNLSENARFMKKLLDHLTKDSPIYAYDQDFEKVPMLLHQIKFIQSLEEGKLDEAMAHWQFLRSISSTTFKDNYQYSGPKCLFSLCLEKHRQKLFIPSKLKVAENISKIDALIQILSDSKSPVAAPLIFEIIWERSLEDKEDLMKLSRLVFRAKKERNVVIEFRKGTYQLKSRVIEKAS